MNPRRRWLTLFPAIAAVLSISSCAEEAASDAYVIKNDPGSVEHVKGTDLGRVSLTEEAAVRLQLETTPVKQTAQGLVVPATAIFVDPEGVWWAYKRIEPDLFVRHRIDIERENNGRVVLSDGPPPGTEVVTVGVSELYGIEAEVGH